MRASFSRLDSGEWGVRVDSEHGEDVNELTGTTIVVTTKNGKSESILLGAVDYEAGHFVKYRKGANGRQVGAPQPTSPQTAQSSRTLEALRYLAGRCDGAVTWDGAGFNKFDTDFGTKLAQRDRLTLREERAAVKMLRKYRKQLAAGGFIIDELIEDFVGRNRQQQAAPKPQRRVELDDDRLVITFPYDADLVEAVKQLPDRRWDSERRVWTLPVERCLEVEKFGSEHGFQFHRDAQAAIDEHRSLAKAEHERTERLIAASKAADSDIDLPISELFPFQRAGAHYALERRRTFLADEMGLGKTIQALAVLEADEAFPALVICPKSVMMPWRREAERWLPHRSVQLLDSNCLIYAADITVINYDIVAKRLEGLWRQFKALILDESHFVKNRKAKRTEAIRDIADSLTDEDPIILCMSGTPLVNRPAELITQLNVMRRMKDVGGFKKYWARYCGYDQRGAQNLNELNVVLRSTCMVRRLKKDVLTELPPRTFADVPADLDNWAEYRTAETNFLAWVSETGGDVRAAERAERLVQMNALRQLAGRGKLKAGIEWIREFLESDGKLVVFAEHKPIQNEVLAALGDFNPRRIFAEDSAEERQQAIDEFQGDESVRVIVVGLRVGGLGITLTAASNACFLELGWTPKDMLQAVDRCHRIGQRDAVTGWQLVAPKTIDDYMAEILAEKREIMDQTLDGKAAADVADASIMDEVIKRMIAGGKVE